MSEDAKEFKYDRTLAEAVARKRDYSLEALLSGKSPDETMVFCEHLFHRQVEDFDDNGALQHAEYLLCLRRERFAAVEGSDEMSVRYGVALIALELWRGLPRQRPPEHSGGRYREALPETKAYLARIFTAAWAEWRMGDVAALALLHAIWSLPTFGDGERAILEKAVKDATGYGFRLSRLRQHIVRAVEMMSEAREGSMESSPHHLLPFLLGALVRNAVNGHDAARRELPGLAAALCAWSALEHTSCEAAGRILASTAEKIVKEQERVERLERALSRGHYRDSGKVDMVEFGIWRVKASFHINPHVWHDPERKDNRASRMEQCAERHLRSLRGWRMEHEKDTRLIGTITVVDPTEHHPLDPIIIELDIS